MYFCYIIIAPIFVFLVDNTGFIQYDEMFVHDTIVGGCMLCIEVKLMVLGEKVTQVQHWKIGIPLYLKPCSVVKLRLLMGALSKTYCRKSCTWT